MFSVLIANYNNGKFFKECYHSLLAQSYSDWEAIIIDDSSTDDSRLIIERLITGDPRFKLFFNKENKGCGFTKNQCVKLAKGNLAGFLDPDDQLKPGSLARMVEKHGEYPEASIISSRFEMIDIGGNFLETGKNGERIPGGESYLTHGNGAITHFASFKVEKYIQTQGIDPKMRRAVDQDLYYNLEEVGKHIFIDEILYRYRQHAGNISLKQHLLKAKYWHLHAIEMAFRRRQKMDNIKNITRSDLKRLKSVHFKERIQQARENHKISSEIYFLYKMFMTSPIQHLKSYFNL